jgi:hypothetical protein
MRSVGRTPFTPERNAAAPEVEGADLRALLIARGVLKPARPGDPSPTYWHDDVPTLRLDRKALDEVRNPSPLPRWARPADER